MSIHEAAAAWRAQADVSVDRGVHATANALDAVKHAEDHPPPPFDPAAVDDLPPWSQVCPEGESEGPLPFYSG